MILVISSESDDHAVAVMQELQRRDASAAMLDTGKYPSESGLTIAYNGSGTGSFSFAQPGGEVIPLNDCRVAWWRRPQPFTLDPALRAEPGRSFALNESFEAIAGLWQCLDALWINHPTREEVAARKAYQLKVAQSLGMRTPHTCITNDPERAREFIAGHGPERTVYKAFSATEAAWRETRVLREGELALIDSVRYAPVIFQEYIEADIDLRVTVIGKKIFAAEVHSQATAYKVDYRMDMASATMGAHKLPAALERKLHAFMDRMGLIYGAIDLRRKPDGEYVFLEINPSGQWLFIEERTKQPITEAFVDYLLEADKK